MRGTSCRNRRAMLEANGDAIFVKRPQLFDQAIIEFFGPLPFEKLDDGRASLQEFGSVPPAAVFRVSERDALRITCVPGIFGLADLLDRGLKAEGGQRWSALGHGRSPVVAISTSSRS